MTNRSIPCDTVLPHLCYENVTEAVEWLSNPFGFAEHYRYGEPVSGAQMYLGKAYIMVNRGGSGCATPVQLGRRTQSLTVFVEDVDGHYQRTKSAGGTAISTPVMPPMMNVTMKPIDHNSGV